MVDLLVIVKSSRGNVTLHLSSDVKNRIIERIEKSGEDDLLLIHGRDLGINDPMQVWVCKKISNNRYECISAKAEYSDITIEVVR